MMTEIILTDEHRPETTCAPLNQLATLSCGYM